MKNDTLVSLIIPAYNVEEYLDRCIESILKQTYERIEVILINDGSTDHTLDICSDWATKDSRIIVIDQENRGLSYCRNLGVRISNGSYFAFVDSDDWINPDYVKLMLEEAEQNQAELVVCDFNKIVDGKVNYVKCGVRPGKDFITRMLLLSNSAAWNKLYKKSLWDKNEMFFPSGNDEDTALFCSIVLCAKKIICINESLYNYTKRKGSITSDVVKRIEYSDTLQEGVEMLKRNKQWDNNVEILKRYYMKWISNGLAPCIGKTDYIMYKRIRQSFVAFLERNFDKPIKRACVWGSYNLSKIVRETSILCDPWLRFQYSSIKAVTNRDLRMDNMNDLDYEWRGNELSYEEFMKKRSINGDFWDVLLKEKPEYIVIDLLEERSMIEDIFCLSENIPDTEYKKKNRILWDQYKDNWKTRIKVFVENLRLIFEDSQIIIVTNYLTKHYSLNEKRKRFDNINKIEIVNQILKKMYLSLIDMYPNLFVIDKSTKDEYYTDGNYEYGCYPWHLNDEINHVIADEIELYVRSLNYGG